MGQWKEWVNEYWKIILSISVIILGFIILFSIQSSPDENSIEDENQQLYEDLLIETGEEEEIDTVEENNVFIMVDIKGAVHSPGVYELKNHSRLLEAIEMAGGFTEEADSRTINLAQVLTDQMMIYIPKEGEELEEGIISDQGGNEESQQKININSAEETELTQLKGVGETRAQSIIDYRTEHGRFETIEEIKNVSGIGDSIFEGMEDEITVH